MFLHKTFLLFTIWSIVRQDGLATVSTLQQLHVVFRHGEKTPTYIYKNDPNANYKWEGGLGQLTNKGKQQMYTLGQTFANIYEDFLPGHCFPTEVKVLSSYADRCQMSAEVLLAGMFPPKDVMVWNQNLLWQPFAIHSTPREKDNMIAMRKPCEKYDKQFQEVFKSIEMQELDKEYADLYRYLTKHTGETINNIAEIEKLYYTLETEETNNLTLPEWTKSVYPKDMQYATYKTLAIYTDNDYMKRMKGGVFIKQAVDSMRRKLSSQKEPKVYLYAAHDLTIVCILRAMGVKNMFKPGLGASFVVELYSNNTSSHVKVLYRDDFMGAPEELKIPKCPKVCTLEDFQKALNDFIPVDWERDCKNA